MIPLMAVHDVNGLPMFFDRSAGQYRVCGRIKTAKPKMLVGSWADLRLRQGQAPDLLTTGQIPDYDRRQTTIPILDQGQVGSCVCHGLASQMMKSFDLSGATYVPLSPDSLYAQIDNDVDEGSDPMDGVTALEKTGICTLADVPDQFVLLKNISAAVLANAARFRIVPAGVYTPKTFGELVTACWLGASVGFTINVGSNFDPNSQGLVGFTAGVANHYVNGGQAKKTVNGVPWYLFDNSWNTTWGINGSAYITAHYVDDQPDVEMVAIMWPLFDPNDPLNPPS